MHDYKRCICYIPCIDFAKYVEIQGLLLPFETIELIIHMCSYEDTSLTLHAYIWPDCISFMPDFACMHVIR